MRKRLRFLRQAERDVAEIIAYLSADGLSVTQKFRQALQETGELLLAMPRIGSTRLSGRPELKDIRVVPIRGFEKLFIFYRSFDNGIEIIRVLHGARDYPTLFGADAASG
jgi:toxin ParE1/3/4